MCAASMNILIPLLSLTGPVYFAVRGFPLEFVLAWSAVWTVLRWVSIWKQAFAFLKESDDDEPPSWLDQYPSVAFAGTFVATLMMFEATHVVVYWTISRLIGVSN
jgi:hypothetical protein